MADQTHIAWTDATWNPVLGCRKVSAGCDNCYAIRDANRLASAPSEKTRAAYAGLTRVQNGRLNWTGEFRELPERLDQPLRWKRPRRVFVNSMSDLFGEGISEAFIWQVFAIMAGSPQHQFQVLTKRPERMQRTLTQTDALFLTACAGEEIALNRGCCHMGEDDWPWPLPNVWLGCSVENQKAANERIPLLLETPAAVRFLSCEPLLGPIDLEGAARPDCAACGGTGTLFFGHDWKQSKTCATCSGNGKRPDLWFLGSSLHWVIVGGESGIGARPCRLEWMRSILQQCQASGIACFVKQLGALPAVLQCDGLADWPEHIGYRKDLAATDVLRLRDRKGGDWSEWCPALRVREFPEGVS